MDDVLSSLPFESLTWFSITTEQQQESCFHVRSSNEEQPRITDTRSAIGSRAVEELKTVLTPTVKDYIACVIGSVSGVESIYTATHGRVMHVCVIADDPAKDIRYEIYNRQRAVIKEFDLFEFDFDLICRQGRAESGMFQDPSFELVFNRK